MKDNEALVQGVLFEDNYLVRTHKTLTSNPIVALTELVANAWDAGASLVRIVIPQALGQELSIEDDGTGLTKEEFLTRWPTLSYNRLAHQGEKVIFPPDKEHNVRIAFGRNGIGRHGMLCFAPEYSVITTKGKTKCTFNVSTRNQALAITPEFEETLPNDNHGTRLFAIVEQNRPDPERVLEELAKRFIADPSFVVEVNGKTIDTSDLMRDAKTTSFSIEYEGKHFSFSLILIDTEKAHKNTIYQGVAFWQGKRLVGEPSWVIGKIPILDGRTQLARRYTFIVETNDLADYVNEDWSGFIKHPTLDYLFDEIVKHIEKEIQIICADNVQSIKESVTKEHEKDFESLSPLGKYELKEAVNHIVRAKPTISHEMLSVAMGAIINLEKSRNGVALLQKLSQINPSEIDDLNRLLDDWSIKDALCVLDEIDRRISVIEAINKLSHDKNTDELHGLHPLITHARWIFGPEFDSPEYIANSQLQTVAKRLFDVEDANFINKLKRPDLIVKGDFTYGITGTETMEGECNISKLNRVLLIELKRGGFVIGKAERTQASNYVEELFDSETITADSRVYAFVVGDRINKADAIKVKDDRGIITPITFSQIVDTANKRLFKLRDMLSSRYSDVDGVELAKKTVQLTLF